MKESHRLGLLASVVQMLNEADSWTGRMHIQKLVYFAQRLLGLQSGYEFVLYQRGPYSFDLDADIRSLRSIGAAEIRPSPPPYGPKYLRTSLGEEISKLSPVEPDLTDSLVALAKTLGPKTASELELLATTHYVMYEVSAPDKDVATRVVSLKPQFNSDEVMEALRQVRDLESRFL